MTEPIMTPKVDRITGSALIIDHAEHDIHEGRSFKFEFESSAPLPTDVLAITAVAFKTPAATVTGKRLHLIVAASADDESIFELQEDTLITINQGTARLPLNRDRESAIESVMLDRETSAANRISTFNVAEAAAANIALGSSTVLHSERIAIAAGPPFGSILNTVARSQREFVLAFDTEYVVMLSNVTANNTVHKIILNWSEDTPEDFAN